MKEKFSPFFIGVCAIIIAGILCLCGLDLVVVLFSSLVILGAPFFYYWRVAKNCKGGKCKK